MSFASVGEARTNESFPLTRLATLEERRGGGVTRIRRGDGELGLEPASCRLIPRSKEVMQSRLPLHSAAKNVADNCERMLHISAATPPHTYTLLEDSFLCIQHIAAKATVTFKLTLTSSHLQPPENHGIDAVLLADTL